MFAFIAFLSLGAFIGTLVGFSADSLVKILIPLVFTFAGGSVIAFQEKLDSNKTLIALQGLLGIGIGGLIGLVSSIAVNEARLLSPASTRGVDMAKLEKAKDGKYLRSDELSVVMSVAQRLRAGSISPVEAAEKLESTGK